MSNPNIIQKKQLYSELIPQVKSLIDGVDNHVGALANVAALLHDTLPFFSGLVSTS